MVCWVDCIFFIVSGMWMVVGTLDVVQRNESDMSCPCVLGLHSSFLLVCYCILFLHNSCQKDFIPT